MGCIQGKAEEEPEKDPPPIGATDAPPKTVDPRLPFDNYRQLFQMKNSWKAVSRALGDTAKDNLIRFFATHPEHKALHKNLVALETEEQMRASTAFENAALAIYDTFDEAMEVLDKVDMSIDCFKRAGRAHVNIEGFKADYFKDMEDSFVRAAGNTLGDRFNDAAEQNFHRLFGFGTTNMLQGYTEGGGNQL